MLLTCVYARADLNIHAFFRATTPMVPSSSYRLEHLWEWFDQPYGHEVPLVLKNLYYSIQTSQARDASLPAFYVPHLSAIQIFPLKDATAPDGVQANMDGIQVERDLADNLSRSSSSHAAASAPATAADGMPTGISANAGGGAAGYSGSSSLSTSPLLQAHKIANDRMPEAQLSASDALSKGAWHAPGAAAAASHPTSLAAGVAAAGSGCTARSLSGSGGGGSSWLQVAGRSGVVQGANSRGGDAAGAVSEGTGAGAWKSGKPCFSSAGAGAGAGSGSGGGAWGKPKTFAAVLSTPKPPREGASGSGGADAWAGKGARGGDAGVWDGEKQAQIDEIKLQCEKELAKWNAAANDCRGRNSKTGNGATWGVSGEEALKGPPPIFEFFEERTPGDRPPLFDNILELAAGEGPGGKDGQKGEAQPMLLEALNTDLDQARSWFAVAWYPILCHSQTARAIKGSFITYHRLSVASSWDAFLDKHYPAKQPKHVPSAGAPSTASTAPGDASKLAAKGTSSSASAVPSHAYSQDDTHSHMRGEGGVHVPGAAGMGSAYSKWAAFPSVVSWLGATSPPRTELSVQRAPHALQHGLEAVGKRWDHLPSVVTWKTVSDFRPARGRQEPATSAEVLAGGMRLLGARGGGGGTWSHLPSVVTWTSTRAAVGAVEAMATEGAAAAGDAYSRPATERASVTADQGVLPVQLIG